VGYVTLDRKGKILSANLTAVGLLGVDRSKLLNQPIQHYVLDVDVPAFNDFLAKNFNIDTRKACEVTLLVKGDSRILVRIEATFSGGGRECRAVLEDITEQKKMQDQLRQGHKMEAIGQLAAGIAHDFNNLLTTIIGYAELMLYRLTPGDQMRQMAEDIHKAGTRAAVLTRQLLAFSRKTLLLPKLVNLGETVTGMERMLTRMIGEDITLKIDTDPELWTVKADPAQIEQILLNLGSNSRDAMPRGGSITVSTANVMVTESFAQSHQPLKAGHYVVFTVQDKGCGMSEETLSHLFEPFFTTKEIGRGTGLGLASVYGIVKQSGAHIFVTSEEGKGTTVRIYFPRVFEKEEKVEVSKASVEHLAGTETILVVEDEEFVLVLVTRILLELGYTVLGARSGEEALEILKKKERDIRLILTDVVMPRISGPELALQADKLLPGVTILYMSGHPIGEREKDTKLPAGTTFIRKPFSPMVLARIVREALDSAPAARRT
jgi:two-component system cell cycle sensor histidine kinase/response regulator CckA